MKYLSHEVEKYERYGNRPNLNIFVDKMPADSEYLYEEKDGVYFAEAEGSVRFYYYTKPGRGFGGSVFHVKMKDGSTRDLIGPWSSRAGAVNQMGFPPVVDVVFKEPGEYCGMAAHATVEWLEKNGVKLVPCYINDEPAWEPAQDDGSPFKPWDEKFGNGPREASDMTARRGKAKDLSAPQSSVVDFGL